MDKVTLKEKGKEFMTRYAAPSVLTGYFVAAVIGSTEETVTAAFTNPGDIMVQNVEHKYADKVYAGYRRINEIRVQPEQIIVILDRGANDA